MNYWTCMKAPCSQEGLPPSPPRQQVLLATGDAIVGKRWEWNQFDQILDCGQQYSDRGIEYVYYPVKCQHIQTWNMDATQTKFYHKYRQTANDMAYLSKWNCQTQLVEKSKNWTENT